MNRFSAQNINNSVLELAQIGFEFEFYSNVDYYELLRLLNQEFAPIQIKGFKHYHAKHELGPKSFKIEPDNSGGDDMVELVTYQMPYHDARIILLKTLKFLQKHAETNQYSAFQFNVSFDEKLSERQVRDLNQLKFILSFDEDQVYDLFPNRINSIYAQSIKRMLPFKQFNFLDAAIQNVKTALQLPDSKYYGINFTKVHQNYLEYRYLGGENYQFKTKAILNLMDSFILQMWNCIGTTLNEQEEDLLRTILSQKITHYEDFLDIDNFIIAYPEIEIMCDTSQSYDMLKTYWPQFGEKLYDFMSSVKGLGQCRINYDSERGRLEIIGAQFDIIFPIEGYDFIDCEFKAGEIIDCYVIDSKVNNCKLGKCKVYNSTIDTAKLYNCKVNKDSKVINSFFNKGEFEGVLVSSIFRRGKIKKNARFEGDNKFVSQYQNFFKKRKRKISHKKEIPVLPGPEVVFVSDKDKKIEIKK